MSAQIDIDAILERLREGDVIEETPDGRIAFTEEFREARERRRREARTADGHEWEIESFEGAETPAPGLDDVDEDVLADAIGIREACDGIDPETSVRVALSLTRSRDAGRTAGVPDGFLPLSVDEVDAFIEGHPASVLYFWREDCPPCDALQTALEELVRDRDLPDALGLGAVYGPEDPAALEQKYDVAMAPTVLFCSGSGIDSRLVGTPEPAAVRNEIDILVEDNFGD